MKYLYCWARNLLCLTELKSMSEAAGGTCPLGSQRLGSSQWGGRCFLRKLSRTCCSSLKMGPVEDEKGHQLLWTTWGVRYLNQISRGPWADFLPWHVEVRVQICCSSGESSRAPVAPGWRSCRAPTSCLKQWWWAGGWREQGESLAQPSAWGIRLGGRTGLQVPLSARLRQNRASAFCTKWMSVCMLLVGEHWLFNASQSPLWFGSCP